MAKRNTLKQEYYKTTFNSYWKDADGKPTIDYVNWLEDKILKKQILPIDIVMVCDCTHTQACKICGEEKGLDGDFWKNLKS